MSTEILMKDSAELMCRTIKQFVKLAKRLLALHNYNGLMEVISGLNNSSVQRLKSVWKQLDEKTLQSFEELEELMDVKQNYKTYRDTISELLGNNSGGSVPANSTRKVGKLPYLAIFLRDITFISVGSPTYLADGSINLDKLVMLHEQTKLAAQFQNDSTLYEFENPSEMTPQRLAIQNYILSLPLISDYDVLYSLSQQAEASLYPSTSSICVPPDIVLRVSSDPSDPLPSWQEEGIRGLDLEAPATRKRTISEGGDLYKRRSAIVGASSGNQYQGLLLPYSNSSSNIVRSSSNTKQGTSSRRRSSIILNTVKNWSHHISNKNKIVKVDSDTALAVPQSSCGKDRDVAPDANSTAAKKDLGKRKEKLKKSQMRSSHVGGSMAEQETKTTVDGRNHQLMVFCYNANKKQSLGVPRDADFEAFLDSVGGIYECPVVSFVYEDPLGARLVVEDEAGFGQFMKQQQTATATDIWPMLGVY